jgi:hypothetical protein
VRLSWSCPPEKNLNNLAKMASLCISHFQFFETAYRQFTPFFVTKYKWKRTVIFFFSTHTQATSISGSPISMSLYFLLLDSHTSDLNIRLTNIDVSLFSPSRLVHKRPQYQAHQYRCLSIFYFASVRYFGF